jgi:hypothetical protein
MQKNVITWGLMSLFMNFIIIISLIGLQLPQDQLNNINNSNYLGEILTGSESSIPDVDGDIIQGQLISGGQESLAFDQIASVTNFIYWFTWLGKGVLMMFLPFLILGNVLLEPATAFGSLQWFAGLLVITILQINAIYLTISIFMRPKKV